MRILLVKRLESSLYAFQRTLDRFITVPVQLEMEKAFPD